MRYSKKPEKTPPRVVSNAKAKELLKSKGYASKEVSKS